MDDVILDLAVSDQLRLVVKPTQHKRRQLSWKANVHAYQILKNHLYPQPIHFYIYIIYYTLINYAFV